MRLVLRGQPLRWEGVSSFEVEIGFLLHALITSEQSSGALRAWEHRDACTCALTTITVTVMFFTSYSLYKTLSAGSPSDRVDFASTADFRKALQLPSHGPARPSLDESKP